MRCAVSSTERIKMSYIYILDGALGGAALTGAHAELFLSNEGLLNVTVNCYKQLYRSTRAVSSAANMRWMWSGEWVSESRAG